MRVGIIFVFVDYHRKGAHHRGVLQPQIGPLIAALLPAQAHIEVINDTWDDPDWSRDYDLLFIAGMHSDFDRARQISHYWRRRGAKTVYGGTMASTYPQLCQAYFDAIVIGDPEGSVPQLYRDFCRGELQPRYVSGPYDPSAVPTPRFDLTAQQQLLPLGLEATRGCPFACEFCALTGLGTRHHTRPVASVVRDVLEGTRMLRDSTAWHRRQMLVFYDNNIGGNLGYLRELAAALQPLNLRWGSSITFNAIANAPLIATLARSGCRFLYVGLESFNALALTDMRKHQNVIHKTRQAIRHCHDHGILLQSGLMLSPALDDSAYIRSVPRHLEECGLHVPSYICFETPIPGTPHFHRLANQSEPAFLPDALLRDFNTYTLVVRPRRESLEHFVSEYRWLLQQAYSRRARLAKCARDAASLLPHGGYFAWLLDLLDQWEAAWHPHPQRTYIAGTDVPPPESVPLTSADFDSAEQYRAIMEPWRVSDGNGRVLPMWRDSLQVFKPKGEISQRALNRPGIPGDSIS